MGKKEDPPNLAPLWMSTFSDMMSLLLCFFILLFALSTIEKKKKIQALGSLKKAFGGLPAPYLVENIPDRQTAEKMSREVQQTRRQFYAKSEVMREEERQVKSLNLQSVIQVTGTEQGITFRLSGDALFDRGSAEMKADAITSIYHVANRLIRYPSNPVLVDGFTDSTGDEDVNWVLSAQRAYNVMKYLIDVGSKSGRVNRERFSYQSYGEFKPVESPSDDDEDFEETDLGRWLNRRVEITLIQTDQLGGTYFSDSNLKDPRSPLSTPPSEMSDGSEDARSVPRPPPRFGMN